MLSGLFTNFSVKPLAFSHPSTESSSEPDNPSAVPFIAAFVAVTVLVVAEYVIVGLPSVSALHPCLLRQGKQSEFRHKQLSDS